MAKKKNNPINYVPLTEVTIGEIKENKYGWIFIIVLFILFIALIYFLPNLYVYYEMYFGDEDTKVYVTNKSNENIINNNITNNTSEITKYTFETTEVNVNNFTINNLVYDNTNISFDILNNNANEVNLESEYLFLELYDINNELIQRNYLTGKINSNDKIKFAFNVNSLASFYTIRNISKEDFDYIDIEINDNKESILSCTKNNQTIIYTFIDDKLTLINDKDSISKISENAADVYANYKTNENLYANKSGITVSSGFTEIDYTYNLQLDYNSVSITLDNVIYFTKNESPRTVNFIMESLGYSCK